MSTSTQRRWRAACPQCGAPIEFASAASASAVCSFCRSTVVREGEALRQIGTSAALFDDHSPLQLGATGVYQGAPFSVLGRVQLSYEGGTWNEWHVRFDEGKGGWLSEDNGRYVLVFESPLDLTPEAAAQLAATAQPGQSVMVGAQRWSLASRVTAKVLAAQGELPRPPRLEQTQEVLDLRDTHDAVGTLERGVGEPEWHWSVGRSVALSELRMQGLKEESEATLQGQAPTCPQCGSPLAVTLAQSLSVVCGQCAAVVDLSAGVGGDLHHYAQTQGTRTPDLPLGATGTLALGTQALPWQIVGYQERFTVPAPGDDESFFWREYLLYNRTAGFAFLVDSDEGWSWALPLTGAPAGGQLSGAQTLQWQGVPYRLQESYVSEVSHVLGEFYWKVQQGQRTWHHDYRSTGATADRRLNREEVRDGAGAEVVWSAGRTLTDAVVSRAFGLTDDARARVQRDVAPVNFRGMSAAAPVWIFIAFVVLMVVLSRCSSDDRCESAMQAYGAQSPQYQQCLAQRRSGAFIPRTGGGSFGGYTSGGSHK